MSAGAHLVKGVPCDGADLGRQAMDVGSAQGLPVNLRPSDSTQGIHPNLQSNSASGPASR